MHDEPTRRDLTAADMDLFAHDARRRPHSIEECTNADCWTCSWGRNLDRLWADSRDERNYDHEQEAS